ncbi:MaoC family dehydratase [Amycolatopsis sp.]|uniref:MaoC family dehydratase n=1 Tax=Amycolatopsis sp. TaxID=37632 RepID=UPI002C60608D|nr:MaoC family dehydratase [Amycolatopsis sp.]HVV07919.1 MaoC family dehydratase [Amycolatopsis sp.]
MRVFSSLDEFSAAAGERLGTSEWHTVTQEQVNTFAEATGDHQWIHVDVEKANKGPFGGPIAHGFLTLSLLPVLGKSTYQVEGLKMGINYGLNKVRFPQPVRVGAKVRATAELAEVSDVPGGKQAVVKWTVEIDGEPKPACIAEFVVRMLV